MVSHGPPDGPKCLYDVCLFSCPHPRFSGPPSRSEVRVFCVKDLWHRVSLFSRLLDAAPSTAFCRDVLFRLRSLPMPRYLPQKLLSAFPSGRAPVGLSPLTGPLVYLGPARKLLAPPLSQATHAVKTIVVSLVCVPEYVNVEVRARRGRWIHESKIEC